MKRICENYLNRQWYKLLPDQRNCAIYTNSLKISNFRRVCIKYQAMKNWISNSHHPTHRIIMVCTKNYDKYLINFRKIVNTRITTKGPQFTSADISTTSHSENDHFSVNLVLFRFHILEGNFFVATNVPFECEFHLNHCIFSLYFSAWSPVKKTALFALNNLIVFIIY